MSDALRLPNFVRRYGVWLACTPVFIALAVASVLKKSEWASVYLPAAKALIGGSDVYAHGKSYLYPPFTALLAVSMTPLGNIAERLLFYLVNVVAVGFLAGSAWRLSGGGRLDGTEPVGRETWVIAGLGIIAVAPYGLNTLAHGQTDLIIDALVTTGCLVVSRGRAVVGGGLIGLGAAFKGPPLLFVLYFLARRRWLEAASVGLVAIGLNLLPDLVHPAPSGGLWLERWLHIYVFPYQSISKSLGAWGSLLIYNQSLGGTLQRLVNTHLVAGAGAVANSIQVATQPLKAVAYGVMAIMLGATLWTAFRASKQTYDLPPPGRFALECGSVLALMLLMSPMSGLAHFPALALPVLCVARLAVCKRAVLARIAVAVAVVAGLAVNKDLVGGAAYNFALWSGVVTLAVGALWLVCIVTAQTVPAAEAAIPKDHPASESRLQKT